jgi:hypothetical protein
MIVNAQRSSEQGIQNSLSGKQQKSRWFRRTPNGPEEEKKGEGLWYTYRGELTRSNFRTLTVQIFISLVSPDDGKKHPTLAEVER